MLLFHGMGSGKTLTSINIAVQELKRESVEGVVVLTPKSLYQNFIKELNKVVHIKSDLRKKFFISSYVQFLGKKMKYSGFSNVMVIVDEAHNFRGIGSMSTKLLNICTHAKKVLLLSATPIQNSVSDFAIMFSILTNTEQKLLKDGQKYIDIFLKAVKQKKLSMLKNKISFVRSKKAHFPDVEYKNIVFRMDEEYYKKYMRVEQNKTNSDVNLKVFLNGIRRAANKIDRNTLSPKIDWVVKLAEKGMKTLIYSNWVESGMKIIQSIFDKNMIDYVSISGSSSLNTRKRAVDMFNSGEIKVMFISAAGAEGLDLKETRYVVILEPHWNDERIKQVIGRAARYKSHDALPEAKRIVTVYRLLLLKPTYASGDRLKSADQILYEISKEKNDTILSFYRRIIEHRIEQPFT